MPRVRQIRRAPTGLRAVATGGASPPRASATRGNHPLPSTAPKGRRTTTRISRCEPTPSPYSLPVPTRATNLRRAILRVLLFALIGAAATVLVAWGFALRGSVGNTTVQKISMSGWPRERAVEAPKRMRSSVPKGWLTLPEDVEGSLLVEHWRRTGPGLSTDSLDIYLMEARSTKMAPDRNCFMVQAGWPSRSLDCFALWDWDVVDSQLRPIVRWRFAIESRNQRETANLQARLLPARTKTTRRLPLRPLWPGFAVNTAFYGGLVFLLWSAPGFMRRRSRRRRGRCLRCGYELAGVAACPECGHQRAPTVREGSDHGSACPECGGAA